ncbi:hypothetical protein BRD01_01155 [Halobacteriales archaeon QS_8_65_32]|jgi:hypothetical protein|nr:MAG: hypothetical protein BRD01_01155 [Halobacteriales archaeon QS_8_65_32]
MFAKRDLPSVLADVRAAQAPGTVVLDAERDFETLPAAVAESLGLFVDSLSPATYPTGWLPPSAPDQVFAYAGEDFTVSMPGDGGVAWTTQTDPPTILVKPRLEGSPPEFVSFLVAEALVQVGLDVPENFLPFFAESYRALDAATTLSPADTYQLAVALYEAYVGLHTRPVFAAWEGVGRSDESERSEGSDGSAPDLHAAWRDAGERLEPRLSGLPEAVALGRTDFADAAELACSAIKHDVEIPTPFGALDTEAYREYGPDYAVQWAETTFEQLEE